MILLSYHNDPELKAAHIAQAEHHVAADMLAKGIYGADDGSHFKGCSVGCFAYEIAPERKDYQAVVAEAAGWPEWLVQLSDALFERLPDGESATFHVELRRRVPIGVDLEPVWHQIAATRMDRLIAQQESMPLADYTAEVLAALHKVRDLRSAAGSAAYSAADSAAYLAAYSAADSAARSAAHSEADLAARSAAHSAAYSAADSAACLAAGSAAYSAACSAAYLAAYSAAYQAERDALFVALQEVDDER